MLLPDSVVEAALGQAPRVVRLFDALGEPTHWFGGDAVYARELVAKERIVAGVGSRCR